MAKRHVVCRWIARSVGSVGAEVMVEVFRVSGVVAGAGVAVLCSAFAAVVVTACVDGTSRRRLTLRYCIGSL